MTDPLGTDPAMSPMRALRTAINLALDEEGVAGRFLLVHGDEPPKVSRAAFAAHLAHRILELMPEGWVVIGAKEVAALEAKTQELDGLTMILAASRLLADDKADSWEEAVAIARDPGRFAGLYPVASGLARRRGPR